MTLLGMSSFKGSALDIFSELLKAFEFYWQMVGDNVGRVPQMHTQLQVEISWKIRQMPFFVVCPFVLTICTKGKKKVSKLSDWHSPKMLPRGLEGIKYDCICSPVEYLRLELARITLYYTAMSLMEEPGCLREWC